MHFDWSVNAGTILSTLTLVIAFVVAHIKGVERLVKLETKVDLMFRVYEQDMHR